MGMRRPSTEALGIGCAIGILHLALAGTLAVEFATFMSGREFPFDDPVFAAGFVISAAGAVLVGLVPAVALLDARLVTPALAVITLFVWGGYGTWAVLQAPGVATGPTPLDLYLVGWFVVLAVALFAGAVEYGSRRLGRVLSALLPYGWGRFLPLVVYGVAVGGLAVGYVIADRLPDLYPQNPLVFPVTGIVIGAVAFGVGRAATQYHAG